MIKIMGQSSVKWIQLITETLMKKKKPHNLGDEDSSGMQAKETMKTHTEKPYREGSSESSIP